MIDELNQLQEKYVFVPTDKAANNISVICKQFYIKTMLNELKVYDLSTSSNTYQNSDLTLDEVLRQHTQKLAKWKIIKGREQSQLVRFFDSLHCH